MKKPLIALCCLLSSQVFAANFSISINAHNEMKLDKNSKTGFTKRSSILTGSVAIIGQQDGREINVSDKIPAQRNDNSDFELNVLSKNLIQIIDRESNIKGKVTARVKKSITGKVKSIHLDSKEYEALYKKSLEETGLGYLKQLGVITSEGEVNFNYELSDFVCENDKKLDLLSCDQDLIIKVSFTDEVKGADAILKEIDKAIGVIDSYNIVSTTRYDINSFINVLREIDAAISSNGYKSEFKEQELMVKKFKNSLKDEILDSYNYDTIRGAVANQILNSFKSHLQSIRKSL